MNEFPWYRSAILQAQVVAFVMAALSFFNITLDFDLKETVAAVFAGVGALAAIYTFIKRLIAPAPNLTKAADAKEKELVLDNKLSMDQATSSVVKEIKAEARQAGFIKLPVLWSLGAAASLALIIIGCTATRGAYQAADSPDELAFVVSEHYSAILHEAADLAEDASTPAEAKAAIKEITARATPLVQDLRPLRDAYLEAAGAVSEGDDVNPGDPAAVEAARARLSAATAKAAAVVAELIRKLKELRNETAYNTLGRRLVPAGVEA